MATKKKMNFDPLVSMSKENGAVRKKRRKGKKMKGLNADLLESSFNALAPQGELLVSKFYEELFKRYPSVQSMFSQTTPESQQGKLLAALKLVVKNSRNPKVLKRVLTGLGERHQAIGALADHYQAVASTLLDVMSEMSGDLWTDDVDKAWQDALDKVSKIMMKAYSSEDADMVTTAVIENDEEKEAKRFNAVVDNAMTPIMMIDRDLTITYVNKSTVDLLSEHELTLKALYPSFSVDTLIGTCIDIFHSNPLHQRQMLANPNNLPYSTDIVIGPLTFRINVTAMYDESGNYVGNSLEWSDVTSMRAAEDEAIRLKGTVDAAMTAIMMIDRDFNITYVNESTRRLFRKNEQELKRTFPGFTANNLIGVNIDVFHKNPDHQRQLLSDPKNLPYQTDIQVGVLRFNLNVTAILDSTGNYIGNALEWDDVTDTRRRLADSEGKIAAINKAQAVIEFELDGTIQTANENFLEATGYTLDEIQGQHHSMFVVPEQRDSIEYRTFWEKLGRGEFDDGQYKRIAKGGKEVWLQATYNPIIDANGKPFKVVKYASDITVQKNTEFELQRVLEESSRVMGALSTGDLTELMTGEYSGEFAVLRNAVNSSITNLKNMVGEILQSSVNISTASSEIAQGNADLSQRTEEQASSLEETASSMEELTGIVKQNAEYAGQANQLATGASSEAENGGKIVHKTIEAMAAISKSSKEIADIIGVIDEIAFQTNLLALNAAVEAARAGEQGRGFAVVAAEVRNLAQRSASAAKEIKSLIKNSVEKVDEGNRLVDESGISLEEIVTSVKKVSDIIAEIAAASQEQSSGIDQISRAVTQMDEMTQQNAALVEEAAASSESLDEQANGLSELMEFFNTGQEQKAIKTPRRPVRAENVRSEIRAAPIRKNKPVVNDNEWEEF